MNATANITVDANITGDGSNNLSLTADSEPNGVGNLVIAGGAASTVTTAGNISLTGEDVTVGVGGSVGKVITTGVGGITIRADNDNSGTNGVFTIATAGSMVSSTTSVDVTNAFEVTIGGAGIFANSGDISITGVNDDINISSAVQTLSGGDITMTAGVNVLFDAAAAEVRTTDEGNVTITATAGNILETVADANADVDVAGYQISLSALNGRIGEDLGGAPLDDALEIDSRSWVSATTATANGDIWLAETAGTMYLNNITTGSTTTGTVTLEALDSSGTQINNGAIEDALIVSPQITAGSARLDAQRGIGILDTLNTSVGTLAAQTDDHGIYLTNNIALIIGTVNSRVGVVILDTPNKNEEDAIHITTTGATSSITVNNVVTNNDGGDITLAAEGTAAANDLTINADVSSVGSDGSIYLYAGDSITQGATADVTVASSGSIYYYAGIDHNDGTTKAGLASGASDITMTSGATATSTSGNITMYAPRDIYISTLTTTGNATITADYSGFTYGDLNHGEIFDNLAAETANLTVATATLRAATGIGSTDDIETNITTLDALNTTSGNIQIYEVAAGTDLNVNQATQQTAGNIDIRTENGTLTISANQSGVTAAGAGTITLIAGDSDKSYTEDLVINDGVTSASGIVTLTSDGDDVRFGAGGDVTTTSGLVDVNAESGLGLGQGVIFMADGAVINSGSAQTTMNAYGDITLGGVTTTFAAADAIIINSAAGGIVDGGDADIDITANSVGAIVNLDAVTGIGSGNALETKVASLEAKNTTTGNIKISETDAITLKEIINQAVGSVDVTAGGTITTTVVTADHGAVNLYATAGDLLDTAGGLITATAESTLKASGVVGTNANPMDVNIDGKLWILAGSMQDEVSANIVGTVNGGDATERVEILLPAPPGLVILDNHLMGGGNYGSGSSNGSILSRGYGYMAIVRADMFSAVYQQGLQPWGHNMLLPWVLGEGAKMDDDFLSSLPAVIDVSQLNLPLLNGGSQTANIYVIRSLK